MNPKQFLQIGGIVLIVVGILGFVGIIGPSSEQSIFGTAWWFDNGENWAHLVLGVVGVATAYWANAKAQKILTQILAVVAIFFGIYGFLVGSGEAPNTFGLANLENPLDNILHLAIGVWAGYAGWYSKG